MKTLTKLRTSMAFNLIGAIILLLLIFGFCVYVVGYISFSKTFIEEYSATTFHMADTATTLINGDHIDSYLAGEETEEYQQSREALDAYCQRINVSLIYVIKVDTSDYEQYTSVFNLVNNSVDNTNYKPWELGHQSTSINEEIRLKYQAIYEQKSEYETVFRTVARGANHSHITTLVPVKNSAGEVVSILCMQRPIREIADATRPYLITVALLTVGLAVIASVAIGFFIRSHFVSPVTKVSQEATRFAQENTQGEPLGKLSRFSEISDLSQSIDTMESEMIRYIENLTAVTADKERIMTELNFARKIQDDSIPNIFPPFPGRSEFDLFASMTPAKEVGGDFYNFFMIDDDHLAIVIGDVSGKGVPAALFMMICNIIVSDRTRLGGTPAEIMNFVNNSICENNKSEMFVTLWLGILEIPTGKISAVNAGHDDPAVYHKNGSFRLLKTKHGLVCGAFPGVKYEDVEFTLKEGDKIFLYTDGVTEATDESLNMFTEKRMLKALNEYKTANPKEVLSGVQKHISEFVGDAAQFDDLTMLCLEMKEISGKNKAEGRKPDPEL